MNFLQTIVEQKRKEIAALPLGGIRAESLRETVRAHGPRRDFLAALLAPRAGDIALIAEVKKASPSAGVICSDFDPVRIAREYEAAGASCLSVLTDAKFFQGSLGYLREIREAVALPLLRKDFMIDARQIREAIEWGADAILLIAAILSDAQLEEYASLAESAGLAALVEVHDEAEMKRALEVGATLIGVNNRDLTTFSVDLGTTEKLSALLKAAGRMERTILVGESGIHTRQEVERLRDCGCRAILVGESLMRGGDIQAQAASLLGLSRGAPPV